jgi:hypothetical protein
MELFMNKILILIFSIIIHSFTICADKKIVADKHQQIRQIIRAARTGIKCNTCVSGKIAKAMQMLEDMPQSNIRTNQYAVLERLLKRAEKICKK